MQTAQCTFASDLALVRVPLSQTSYDAILRALGDGLFKLERTLHGEGDGEHPDRDALVEDVIAEKESLIGMAYSTCQCHIQSVTCKMQRINERLKAQKFLPMPKQDKRDLTEICKEPYIDTVLSKVTAIDVFASYFKHRDKWPARWTTVDTGSLTRTIKDVRFIGLAHAAPDNLSRSVLGFNASENLFIESLLMLMDDWTRAVHAYAETELRARNVI